MDSMNLRGLIISKYHTVLNFGKALNWSSRKTYDLVNGKQEPTLREIEAMCKALSIEISEQMQVLFFAS